jgi:molybdate transport system substrate-binding protein
MRNCVLLATALFSGCNESNNDHITLFAASSLHPVLDKICEKFEESNDVDVVISYGASSVLARQIIQGAQADIYVSANQMWMDAVEKNQLLVEDTRTVFTRNQLVLIGRENQEQIPVLTNENILETLEKHRFAVGDPSHVPVGIYTKQVLTKMKLWERLQPQIIPVKNARALLMLVERGEIDFAISYRSDAERSSSLQIIGTFDSKYHSPILYPIAITKQNQHPKTPLLHSHLLSKDSKEVLLDSYYSQPFGNE